MQWQRGMKVTSTLPFSPGRTETHPNENDRTMTCTGGRLAAFARMDDQLSVPRDVRRSSHKTL